MTTHEFETFTDRHEAIALFNLLRGRNPHQPWPLLPILTFIAPGGSGKSTLIEYLRLKECSHPNGHSVLPYAYLDFNQPSTPKTTLSIFVALRNHLQSHADGNGRNLTFPRFDLGAAIALAAPTVETMALTSPKERARSLKAGAKVITGLDKVGNDLNNAIPYIGQAISLLKGAAQLSTINALIQQLEKGSGWKWYAEYVQDPRLRNAGDIGKVMLQLSSMSMPDDAQHTTLIEEILPAAFVADLMDALDSPQASRTWDKTTNIVFFFDGFETLMAEPGNRAIRLLECLARTEHRQQGKTDPFLLVIGSRQRLLEMTQAEQDPSLEEQTTVLNTTNAEQQARERYENWRRALPVNKSFLGLKDLYLPLWLQDFGIDDTRAYLSRLDRYPDSQIFADPEIVDILHRITHGHPLYLSLAAAAILEALARGNPPPLQDLERAPVPPDKRWQGQEDEPIGDYLLNLLLRQLPEDERRQMVFCAAPRTLDSGMLRVLLQLPSDLEARERWQRYRRMTFLRASTKKQLVFHPIVRSLLLRRLIPDRRPESDYYQVHSRLRSYFASLVGVQQPSMADMNKEQAQIEEAFHALALGDPEPALTLALAAQRGLFTSWAALIEAVEDSLTALMPPEIEQRANTALASAEQNRSMQESVTALILYRWLMTASNRVGPVAASHLGNMGRAYTYLPGGNRQANLEAAIACLKGSLQIFTPELFPKEWAATQGNLGVAYRNLPGSNRQANLKSAIACFQQSLQVYTREAYPESWATTQHNIGSIYNELEEDRQATLEKAIVCFNAALEIRTYENFPTEWADTQDSLGNAYRDLPDGDRQANLMQAIACYENALRIRTREASPIKWAATQNNLGSAYSDLPDGDRQADLERAIDCLQSALEVRTREDFPADWATTQNNLGTAYSDLPSGDRRANLEQAITCYQGALEVYESMNIDYYAQYAQKNLQRAQGLLDSLDE